MPFSFGELYAYVSIVALLVMIPGPNTILVMQSVGTSGRQAGFLNVLGIVTAVYLNALISILGLSFIVLQSTELYQYMKLLGAGYMVYLGLSSMIAACGFSRCKQLPAADEGLQSAGIPSEGSRFACYSKGVLTGVLNPKSALFFLAFFPQFMHPDGNIILQSVILTIFYSLVSAVWYSLLVLFMSKLRGFFSQQDIQVWFRTITGVVLVGMGVRLALQDR